MVALAKATGQRAPTTPPPAVKQYGSGREGEGAPELGVGTDGGGEKRGKKVRSSRRLSVKLGGTRLSRSFVFQKKKKKNLGGAEYYNLTDSFIDDSELAIDERTFIAQTKQQGFYVFSGEVALLKEKSHRKAKSKMSVLPAPEPIAGPSKLPTRAKSYSCANASALAIALAGLEGQIHCTSVRWGGEPWETQDETLRRQSEREEETTVGRYRTCGPIVVGNLPI